MWLVLREGFLSIVKKDCEPDELLVRSRVRSHISTYFPKAKIDRNPDNDYLFRARVKRSEVARVVADYIEHDITTGNFKASVKDSKLHNACMRAWHVFADLQEVAPWSGTRRVSRQKSLWP